jgi:hypothetical protein
MVVSAKQLGRALVTDGVITEDQRLQAFEYQSQHGGSLKDAVLKLGFATEDDLIGAIISNQDLGVSYMGLAGYEVEADVLAAVPSEFAFRNKLIPVSRAGNTLTVAMADPLDMVVINDLRSTTKCSIVPAIAREAEIEEALRTHYQEAIKAAARQAAAGGAPPRPPPPPPPAVRRGTRERPGPRGRRRRRRGQRPDHPALVPTHRRRLRETRLGHPH